MRVGVVVPVHDEAELLPACLDALAAAAHGEDVTVVVVLDSCTDGSAEVCRAAGVAHVRVDVRSAGKARAAGFAWLLAQLGEQAWLASTDADSRVAPDWIHQQLALAAAGADAVFGVVDVDWGSHPAEVIRAFRRLYARTARDETGPHPHRHGACFGLRASAYVAVGGMPPLAVGEDQALADRLSSCEEVAVVSSTSLRVTTSSRSSSRVVGGFATLLGTLA